MKINTKRVVSVIITAVMMVVMLPSFAMGESGKKYTETLQPEGWTLVENEGGATLSYTKGGGVDLIEVDGYAFKDLDRDGELDVFEDWRVDYKERSRDLVTNGGQHCGHRHPPQKRRARPHQRLSAHRRALHAGGCPCGGGEPLAVLGRVRKFGKNCKRKRRERADIHPGNRHHRGGCLLFCAQGREIKYTGKIAKTFLKKYLTLQLSVV